MKIAVSSHGCEWAARNMVLHLKGEGAEFVNQGAAAEMRLLIGYYFHNGEEVQRAELLSAKRRVVWWVGTDILWLEGQGKNSSRVQWLNANVHEHWAEWELSASRLRALGLRNVRIVHMPTRRLMAPMPLPAQFAVGCYCYDSREGFYGMRTIREAARLTPDILWKIYPRRRQGRSGNIEELPRLDPDAMEMVYGQTSVHVRFVQSDGMPQGPMEAAMCGRPVLYNFRALPHVRPISPATATNLAAMVREVRTEQAKGEGMNWEGARYYREVNDPERLRREVRRIF